MIISQDTPGFSEMQNVKRRFFALRNGIVADALRKGGDCHRIIFGLTLVQIKEIAAVTSKDVNLARLLWNNDSTRCSRLLAPMVMPAETLTTDQALQMLTSVMTTEETDVLCHSLLRQLPLASEIAHRVLLGADTSLKRYAALRLYFNLVYTVPEKALEAAVACTNDPVSYVARLATQLAEEARFVLEPEE